MQGRAENGDPDVSTDAIQPNDPLLVQTLEMREASKHLRGYLKDAAQLVARPKRSSQGAAQSEGDAAATEASEPHSVLDAFAVQHFTETIRSADVMHQWKDRSEAALGSAAALRRVSVSNANAAVRYDEEADQCTQEAITLEDEGRTEDVRGFHFSSFGDKSTAFTLQLHAACIILVASLPDCHHFANRYRKLCNTILAVLCGDWRSRNLSAGVGLAGACEGAAAAGRHQARQRCRGHAASRAKRGGGPPVGQAVCGCGPAAAADGGGGLGVPPGSWAAPDQVGAAQQDAC